MEFPREMITIAKDVDKSLMAYLDVGKHEKLRQAMKHYPEAGGKRMRPVMAILVAEAVGNKGSKAMPFGCSLEIIHNFTLVHDDVIDQDPVRRGRPAVHVLFDVPTAIIAGDALFAVGYEVLSETDVGLDDLRTIFRSVSETVYLIAEGQQMDVDFEGTVTVTIEEYLEMVEKKTAVLFACAAEGGAIIGGGTKKQVADMKEYARLMGIGFQMWDDVLGIKGDTKKTGKPVGSDIKNGKRTLIIVHAMEHLKEGSKEKATLLAALGNGKATDVQVNDAIGVLERTGSIEYARTEALRYASEAKQKLDCLKPSREKEVLGAFVDFAVGREA
jgi:geranylgeranyl diphosphate synthase type I